MTATPATPIIPSDPTRLVRVVKEISSREPTSAVNLIHHPGKLDGVFDVPRVRLRVTKPLRPGGVKSPCQPRLFLNPERTCLNDAEQILFDLRAVAQLAAGRARCRRENSRSGADPGAPAFWALAVPYALKHHAGIVLAQGGPGLEEQIAGELAKRYPKAKYVTIFGNEENLPLVAVPDPADQPPAISPPSPNRGPASAFASPLQHFEGIRGFFVPNSNEEEPDRATPSKPVEEGTPKTVSVDLLSGGRYGQPCMYRAGRITGDSLATASLLAAGASFAPLHPSGYKGWMMVNVGGQLPLLECIARATEQSLAPGVGASGPARDLALPRSRRAFVGGGSGGLSRPHGRSRSVQLHLPASQSVAAEPVLAPGLLQPRARRNAEPAPTGCRGRGRQYGEHVQCLGRRVTKGLPRSDLRWPGCGNQPDDRAELHAARA